MSNMMESAFEVMKRISDYGECYMVGGAVRDGLLGILPSDVDFVTNVSMDILESLFGTHDIGKNKDFGIVVVEHNGFAFEVAQYRSDVFGSVDGRGASSVNIVHDLLSDVMRRDFTINSIAMDQDRNIVDHVNGVKDLTCGNIRAVGNPTERFAEDYIRMLRAVRFATRFGFSIESDTAQAIRDNAHNIPNVPAERIMKEVLKMASAVGDSFADSIVLMRDLGLLEHVFPEIYAMIDLPHSPDNHPEGGVYDHTISALRKQTSQDATKNMCVLFHDIGKINTHSVDADGAHHYYNHSNTCSPLIEELAVRMKFDTNLKDAMILCASKHMKFHFLGKEKERKIIDLMNNNHFEVLYTVAECDTKSRNEAFKEEEWAYVTRKVNSIRDKYGTNDPLWLLKRCVNGDDVMTIRGLKPSKEVGDVIDRTINYIIRNNVDFRNKEEVRKVIGAV